MVAGGSVVGIGVLVKKRGVCDGGRRVFGGRGVFVSTRGVLVGMRGATVAVWGGLVAGRAVLVAGRDVDVTERAVFVEIATLSVAGCPGSALFDGVALTESTVPGAAMTARLVGEGRAGSAIPPPADVIGINAPCPVKVPASAGTQQNSDPSGETRHHPPLISFPTTWTASPASMVRITSKSSPGPPEQLTF